MPTLIRFLVVLCCLAALAFGIVYALATLVTVTPRPMEQIVPPARLNR
ncbi:histidine kinase [Lichenihabitans sp. Uapishka_5]|nr:histidine kinase [Lichenihabitans sp. Uapishka_5]MDX7949968.1 histidine kinase [Lichenihabitans sp. Uapishka_5]